MTHQQLKDSALLYCQMTGINPDDLVSSPKDQSTMVPKLDLIVEMIGNQLLVAYCVEETLKKTQQEAK